ncbi:MAG: class I SAM-dependent methyltransferase [Clostridiales bacterium]|nr:class I SAM-dependent methyltransferase [Clostridiales bacterium]
MIDQVESMTAKLCAFARAWHSNKATQKIFDDYLAYDIMGSEEYTEIYNFISQGFSENQDTKPYSKGDVEEIINQYLMPIPVSRIHFSEERLLKFAEGNQEVQYVICGAGSDTFSFRNTNSNIKIFEIDHPDTQKYKLDKIKKLQWIIPKNVNFVEVDFEKEKLEDKLLEKGFNPNIKTCYSILGVSYYLTLPVFINTLTSISEISENGSILIFDYPGKYDTPPSRRVERLAKITKSLGEKMTEGFTYNQLSRALYSLGFQIDTYLTPSRVEEEYFAHRTDGLKAFENVHLISATYTGGIVYE